jgi:hypothetical protein
MQVCSYSDYLETLFMYLFFKYIFITRVSSKEKVIKLANKKFIGKLK